MHHSDHTKELHERSTYNQPMPILKITMYWRTKGWDIDIDLVVIKNQIKNKF